MRTFILAGAAMLTLTANPALAERWMHVGGNDTAQTYVDADSIAVGPGPRYARWLSVYAQPQQRNVGGGVILGEVHCSENYFRTLQYSFYDPTGRHTDTEGSETINERKVPSAGSINESVLEFICRGTGGSPVANAWQDARRRFTAGS